MAAKAAVEKTPGKWVNLFNTGMVVDLKKLQINTIETLIKINENTGKKTRKGL